ncbi:MAG TPA: response regulator [Burkholderiales bacterium]|nr:response regulator [Burkholderiales bacterium]
MTSANSEVLPSAMSIPRHVLVVDDDADLRRMVAEYLGDYDLRVTGAADGAAMREAMSREAIDLVLLDLKLNSEDGMTLARELRETSSVPIVILTGRKDDVDRIMGLELGADDYLTKPFNLRELLARIRAILRRTQAHPAMHAEGRASRAFRFAGWELDLRSRRLTSNEGDRVELTHAEFALLAAFLGAPERILSREQLLELSRGNDDNVFDRSIDVQILRLRRKIETDPSRPKLIRTERGAGYFFNAKVEIVA